MNFIKRSTRASIALLCSLFLSTSCGSSKNSFSALQADGLAPQQPDTKPVPDTKPAPSPERGVATGVTKYYRLMLKDDPATTIVIGYSSVGAAPAKTKVYYDEDDHGQNVDKYSEAASPSAINNYKGLNNYFVELKKLKPEKVYYFVVVDEKGVSERYSFKTQSDSRSTRLSIIAGGDSRSNKTERRKANYMVSKLRPHFVMFAGDMTGSGTNAEWAEWFGDWQLTVGRDGRMTPVLMTRGNHEASNEILEKLFHTVPGVYYAVTFASNLLRVYTLNSEAPVAGAQTDWLKRDLSENSHVTYKFAQYHRPMRPHTAGKADFSTGYSAWAETFFEYGMTLVSEADAHTVKATWPLRPSTVAGSQEGFVRDDAEGTVYIGEGCWGAPLRTNNDNRSWTRASGRFNSFNWIFLDKNQVEVRTVNVDNANDVGELSDSNRFSSPANLNIWKPANGSVITIKPRESKEGGLRVAG